MLVILLYGWITFLLDRWHRWRLMAMPAERIDQPDFAVAWRDLAGFGGIWRDLASFEFRHSETR